MALGGRGGGATARTPGRSSAAPGARGWSTTRTGTITRRERRTLWGVPSETVAECPLGFPGQYLDRETGLYYNFQRYYDPALGRYASPDVLGLAPQPNPHAYVTDPRTWYDPLGLNPCTTAGRDDLLKAANANAKGKGLTAAGRAQQKHGDTNPNNVAKRGAAHVQRYDFGKANNKERNEVGDEMVQEILTDPTAVETIDTNAPAHYGGVQRDIRIPGSWGARWSNRGGNLTFEGFL